MDWRRDATLFQLLEFCLFFLSFFCFHVNYQNFMYLTEAVNNFHVLRRTFFSLVVLFSICVREFVLLFK